MLSILQLLDKHGYVYLKSAVDHRDNNGRVGKGDDPQLLCSLVQPFSECVRTLCVADAQYELLHTEIETRSEPGDSQYIPIVEPLVSHPSLARKRFSSVKGIEPDVYSRIRLLLTEAVDCSIVRSIESDLSLILCDDVLTRIIEAVFGGDRRYQYREAK